MDVAFGVASNKLPYLTPTFDPFIDTLERLSMAFNGFEESAAWAATGVVPADIVKDAIRKEEVLKEITAAQSDLRALITRVHGVQTDVEKLTSENATLQMYIDNLTLQMAKRK